VSGNRVLRRILGPKKEKKGVGYNYTIQSFKILYLLNINNVKKQAGHETTM
jgi:hypothetical protein